MKKIISKQPLNIYSSKIFENYFKGLKCGVFDIETTGLNFTFDRIILTAILTIEENEATITQFLATGKDEEAAVIKATLEFIKEAKIDWLLTYNGASFDIPFMQVKTKKYNLSSNLDCYNLDLYRVFYSYSDLKSQTGSLSQKSMENYSGILSDRLDTIDGKESTELFKEYTKTKDLNKERKILTHNREDVIQLYRLLDLIKFTDFHASMLKYGFRINVSGTKLNVKPKLSGGYLTIKGKQLNNPVSLNTFGDFTANYEAVFSAEDSSFEIKIPAYKKAGGVYIDASFVEDEFNALEYINGYLILEENKIKKHREINLFSMLLIKQILLNYCHK